MNTDTKLHPFIKERVYNRAFTFSKNIIPDEENVNITPIALSVASARKYQTGRSGGSKWACSDC